MDIAVEAEMERLVITVCSSDEDTDTASEGAESSSTDSATECQDNSDTDTADEIVY